MPLPSVTFRSELPPIVRKELDQLDSELTGYLLQEHDDDGHHTHITASSLTVTGPLAVLGGPITVNGVEPQQTLTFVIAHFASPGSGIATGFSGVLVVPWACTITQVTLLSADPDVTSGSIVVDIWKDTYCVDDQTEALTRRGWKRHADIQPDDEILAFSSATRTTQWERPLGYFVDHYHGPMVRIGSDVGRINALVTPNHAWPIIRLHGRRECRLPIERCETRDLPSKGLLLRSAPYNGPTTKTLDDALVRLAAWYFTEGSSRGRGTIITLSQSASVNPENCEAIRTDLVALGAQASVTNGHRPKRTGQRGSLRRTGLWVHEAERADGVVQFVLTGADVDRLAPLFEGAKVPTAGFISALTSDQAKLFIQTALLGDGNGTDVFYQHDAGRMDGFMTIAVLAGYSPSLDHTGTCCSLRRHRPYTWLKDTPRTVEQYTGVVWCPTLPSGYWVARRAGKVFITGNSNYPPTVADSICASAKPTLSSAIKSQDSTLVGWTTALAADDILAFNVESVSSVKRVRLDLRVTLV